MQTTNHAGISEALLTAAAIKLPAIKAPPDFTFFKAKNHIFLKFSVQNLKMIQFSVIIYYIILFCKCNNKTFFILIEKA